jgi:hypothetical protein
VLQGELFFPLKFVWCCRKLVAFEAEKNVFQLPLCLLVFVVCIPIIMEL